MKEYKKIVDKALETEPQKIRLQFIKFQKANPFDNNLPSKEDLFIDREDIIEKLLYEISLGKHKIYHKNIFLTGQTGSGKSKILDKLNHILKKLESEGEKYHFKKIFFEMDDLYETIENEDGTSYKKYVNYKNKSYDIAIFKSGSSYQILDMIRKFQNTFIKIFEISIISWKENMLDLIKNSEVYMIIHSENLEFQDILKIIDLRLSYFNIERNNIINDERIIEYISKICFNNIKFTLTILYEAFNFILKNDQDQITLNLIKSIIDFKKINFLQEEYSHLSEIKKNILKKVYLNNSVNSKKMSKLVKRNWANISSYMKDMSNLGFLKRIKKGKNVEYRLSDFTVLLIENDYLEKSDHGTS